jgi:acetyl-CoA carboxylase biotin carboxyl carrier protein
MTQSSERGSTPGPREGSNSGAGGHERHPIVDLDFLRGLIGAVDDSGIDSLEIARGGTRIRISKTPPPSPVAGMMSASGPAMAHYGAPPSPSSGGAGASGPTPAPASPAEAGGKATPGHWVEIKSPMVGTFYAAPAPEAPAYVEVGGRVSKGQTLCILEAMKLMNELEAEIGGVVREICVENAEPVEYGQVLFRIEPDA